MWKRGLQWTLTSEPQGSGFRLRPLNNTPISQELWMDLRSQLLEVQDYPKKKFSWREREQKTFIGQKDFYCSLKKFIVNFSA